MMPGAIAFTRTPLFAYSIARPRVTTPRPPLVSVGKDLPIRTVVDYLAQVFAQARPSFQA